MSNKLCFITGANSGIGKAAAIQLAEVGFHVLIGSRNEERGKIAVAEIKEKSKSNLVELVQIDLSLKASIISAAKQIKARYDKLDVLIHNAADFDITREQAIVTHEGVESVWATNHIGSVFLTNQLLGLLKRSKQGRIITVASQGLVLYPKLQVDLDDPEFKKRDFSVPKAYYQSKLAQVMYTYWLAEELAETAITVNCIRVTNVKLDLSRYPETTGFMKFLYSIKSMFSISPEKMAETYVYVATSAEMNGVTGKYFNQKNKIVDSSAYSKNPKNIQEAMELTKKYL